VYLLLGNWEPGTWGSSGSSGIVGCGYFIAGRVSLRAGEVAFPKYKSFIGSADERPIDSRYKFNTKGHFYG
jgi:hypothetical protein